MSYPPSIEKALAYLQTVEIPGYYKKITPIHKFLWRKGIVLPPSILADFMPNFIFGGINGALTWVIASLFILLTNGGYTPGKYLFNLVFFIIFFGCAEVWFYQRQRRKFGLLSWQEVQNLPIKTDNPDV